MRRSGPILPVVLAALSAALSGCRSEDPRSPGAPAITGLGHRLSDWRRGATCHEVFVRSFYDSDGDVMGDLRGLTQKLDYINDGDANTDRDPGARCVQSDCSSQGPRTP